VALFLSTFIHKIDRKGRVSVPHTFRAYLDSPGFKGVVVYPGLKMPALEGAGMDRMEELSRRIATLPEFSDERDALSAIFADTQQLPLDGEGRIILPQDLADHAGITDQAAFVGIGSTFQIWEPGRFQAHQQDRRNRARNVILPAVAPTSAQGGAQ
jgi:MraZ protein